jgi:hypothetical protein
LPCRVDSVGAQPAARSGERGAVWAGGVVGDGGAWAEVTPDAAITIQESNSAGFIVMPGKRPARAEVPRRSVI